jgi:hypothetical protein
VGTFRDAILALVVGAAIFAALGLVTHPTPIPFLQCNDTDALLSGAYWRGLAGGSAELSSCWLRGHIEAQTPHYSCAAGSHDIGNGRCCRAGYHAIEGGKCGHD